MDFPIKFNNQLSLGAVEIANKEILSLVILFIYKRLLSDEAVAS
jgi:hypothetical protein